MLELYADCIGIRRDMVFTQTFLTVVSFSEWRKGNIVPIEKKPTIKTLKISFQFLHFRFEVKFLKDWFLTKFLSFSPLINSSLKAIPVFIFCIKQMLSVNHEVFTSFSIGLKRRSFFLDISKGFDKNWHEVLNFKLKENSISGELPLIFKHKERKGCT